MLFVCMCISLSLNGCSLLVAVILDKMRRNEIKDVLVKNEKLWSGECVVIPAGLHHQEHVFRASLGGQQRAKLLTDFEDDLFVGEVKGEELPH